MQTKRNIRIVSLLGLLFLSYTAVSAQVIKAKTMGDNSPIIWAENLSLQYGFRPEVIFSLLKIYEDEGMDSVSRRKKIEQVVQDFSKLSAKDKKNNSLSSEAIRDMQLNNRAVNALEWQLFTTGNNSPIVYAAGTVGIWYGIPKTTFLGVVGLLESKQTKISEYKNGMEEYVRRYNKLVEELTKTDTIDTISRLVVKLLNEGKIDEAEKIVYQDYEHSKPIFANKSYRLAAVRELNFKFESAESLYREAASLAPENSEYLSSYGKLLNRLGKPDSAIIYYKKAFKIDSSLKNINRIKDLYSLIADAEMEKGCYLSALAYYDSCINVTSRLRSPSHPEVLEHRRRRNEALILLGDYKSAITDLLFIMETFIRLYGEQSQSVLSVKHSLGIAFTYLGNTNTGKQLLFEVLNRYQQRGVKNSEELASTLVQLGLVYNRQDSAENAISYLRRAVEIDSTIYGMRHRNIAHDYLQLGSAFSSVNFDSAAFFLKSAISTNKFLHRQNHPEYFACLAELGYLYVKKRNYDSALIYGYDALKLATRFFSSPHPNIANYYNLLAIVMNRKNKFDSSIIFSQCAISILSKFHLENSGKSAETYNNLGLSFKKMDILDSAIFYFDKSITLLLRTYRLNDFRLKTKFHNKAVAEFDYALKHYYEGNLSAAAELLSHSYVSAEAAQDTAGLIKALQGMSNIWMNYNEPDSVISYSNKALSLIKIVEKRSADLVMKEKSSLLWNVGLSYKEKRQFKVAATYFRKAKPLARRSGDSILLKLIEEEGY